MIIVMISSLFVKNVNAESSRLEGAGRYETAVAISQEGWKEGAESVVLARGDIFPDALAGAPFAASKNAPILLTYQDKLPGSTKAELKRLNPKYIYVLGGDQAIKKEVIEELKTLNQNIKIERISGSTRYETATNIARKLGMTKEQVIIATGENFPDALSIAPYAAEYAYPIVLTESDKLPKTVSKYFNDVKGLKKVYVIGGKQAISESAIKGLPHTERIAGNTRYDTSIEILKKLYNTNDSIYVSTGKNFADALTGSVLAGKNKTGILLVDVNNFKEKAISNIIRTNFIQDYVILGGEVAVPTSVEKNLNKLFAQNKIEFGTIQFYVYDANTNEKIDKVNIIATVNGKTFRDVKTLNTGEYQLTLPEGEYDLTISKSGYVTETFYNVTVSKSQVAYLPPIQLAKSGTGKITGTIIDASTQEPVELADIQIRNGYNALEGKAVKSISTDSEGQFTITLPAGVYTFELTKDGYIPYRYFVVSKAGKTITNQNGYLLSTSSIGQASIVLSWGNEPKDLDLHLTGLTSNNQKFHVFWDQPEYKNNNLIASLDSSDAREGFGPELLTIHEPLKGKYQLSVYNYSYRLHNNSSALTHSDAKVDVYIGNSLHDTYYVPRHQTGKIWDVIQIDNGKIVVNNTIHDGKTIRTQSNLQFNIQSIQKEKDPIEK